MDQLTQLTLGRNAGSTRRCDRVAALVAASAVVVVAVGGFLIGANGDSSPRLRDGPRAAGSEAGGGVGPRAVQRLSDSGQFSAAQWASFLNALPPGVEEAKARAAGQQACLVLLGNGDATAAARYVKSFGISTELAPAVVAASRATLCP